MKDTVRKITEPVFSFFNCITVVLAVIAALMVVLMISIVCVAVIMRYYFHFSVGWSTELVEYLIYLSVMLAAPWVLKNDDHVNVDVFINLLSPELRRKISIFVNFLGAVVMVGVFYYGSLQTLDYYNRGLQTVKVMPIPFYVFIMFIPLMAFFSFFQFVEKMLVKMNILEEEEESSGLEGPKIEDKVE